MAAKVIKAILTALLLSLCFEADAYYADCFDDAAAYEHMSPAVLRAMAVVESNDKPHAIRRNTNGTVDIGIMQINSVHLAELNRQGIRRKDLLNACKNIYTAAWLIRRNMNAHQSFWTAVGNYHSATPRFHRQYLQLVRAELNREQRALMEAMLIMN